MKKYFSFIVLFLIIVIAFFIRSFNFYNGLYFEADQVRNANNTVDFLRSGDLEKLPLLGPKAGGTNFHLGPISYYFEILSGFIFGIDHPAVFAFPNFLFLLLSIPLFYYFLKHFFSQAITLLLTLLFSFSYLSIQYSRFSWNPNGIFFWGLLFILALFKLKIEKNSQKRNQWFLILVLGYGISSQLHTLALLGYPLIFFLFLFSCFLRRAFSDKERKSWISEKSFLAKFRKIFLIWKSNCVLVKINWKYWLGALGIIFILYLPLIIYDFNNNGSNFKEFLRAFSIKNNEERGLGEKLTKTAELYGENYTLTISSFNNKEFNTEAIGLIFIIIALYFVFYFFWKNKVQKNKKISNTFLILILSCFVAFFVIHFKLAFDIDQPRFWFPVFFLSYLFLGIIFSFFWKNKIGKILVIIFCGMMFFLNLTAILNWYGKTEGKNYFSWRQATTSTLIQNDFIGYGDLEKVVDWIKNNSEKKAVCFNSPSTYLASYKYIFDNKYPGFNAKRINKTIEMSLVSNCDIFIIDHSANEKLEIEEKFLKKNIEINLEKGISFEKINIWKVL